MAGCCAAGRCGGRMLRSQGWRGGNSRLRRRKGRPKRKRRVSGPRTVGLRLSCRCCLCCALFFSRELRRVGFCRQIEKMALLCGLFTLDRRKRLGGRKEQGKKRFLLEEGWNKGLTVGSWSIFTRNDYTGTDVL